MDHDGVCCSVAGKLRWFHAEEHFAEGLAFAKAWQGTRTVHVLDAFGVSARMACLGHTQTKSMDTHGQPLSRSCELLALRKQWTQIGKRAHVYDIKTSKHHDMVSRDGWYTFLEMALEPLGVCFFMLCHIS